MIIVVKVNKPENRRPAAIYTVIFPAYNSQKQVPQVRASETRDLRGARKNYFFR
jgi:hypothetical protein